MSQRTSVDSVDLERWMGLGETGPALTAAVRLQEALHRSQDSGADLDRLRHAYVALLERRGYRVGSPEALVAAIEEIRDVGPGFDLFDLSEALAAVDAAAAECRWTSSPRRLPELRPFVPECRCGHSPKGGTP
jgi:hypothetical protein